MAGKLLAPRPKIARRTQIAAFMAMDVFAAANARAAAGGDVIHLELGEPGEGPPPRVVEAAAQALDHKPLGYTEALGLRPLREAIARLYRDRHGLDLSAERVVVTTGASGAFVLSFLAAFDPGDKVVVPEPAFPAYRNILTALGIEVVPLALDAASAFKPTVAALEVVPGPLHGLIIASPNNPTGTMLSRAELNVLASFCRGRGMRLLVDEIYHGITFGGPATSILEVEPEAIVINGFSKYFCMTGWRLGWLVLPLDLVRPLERLAQNLFISAPALAQHAALVALECGQELDRRIERYRQNRDLLLEHLPRAGFDRFAPPDGAFYLYAAVDHLSGDSAALCRTLLQETEVALAPGADFDRTNGHRFVRFAFCGEPAEVAEAANRLTAWRLRRG